ncbi:MAG: hypothetical protein JKY37_25220, partial [Nannocystaceae bacterium]|nr:hypothetical protein [Nannocystaceae bacterium]
MASAGSTQIWVMTLIVGSGCTFGGAAGAVPSANVAGVGDGSSSGDLSIPGPTTGPGPDGDGSLDDGTMGGNETPADSSSADESGSPGTTGTAECTNGEWWDTAWSHRRGLRINNTDIGEALVDFPVLVRLTSARVNYARTQDDGAD